MKNKIILLTALLASAGLSAQDAYTAPKTSYVITADVPYVSKYVFRGLELAHDSFQPALKANIGQAYAGLWSNFPVDAEVDNEIDFSGGYNFQLPQGWTLDVGGTYYWYPESKTGTIGHSLEGYAGITGTIHGVTVGGYVYRDFTLDVTTVQGSVGYSVPIEENISLNLTASVGTANPDDGEDYLYYSASATFPYKWSDKLTSYIGVNWASNDLDGAKDNLVWASAGFTYTF